MTRSRKHAILITSLALAACSRTPPPAKVEPAPDSSIGASVGASVTPPAAPAAAAVDAGSGATTCPGDTAKGVTCLRFAKTEDAFRHALRGEPKILAVGEAHAQKGTEAIASSTKRFTEQLLPLVAEGSGDIVVELWAPDPRCQKEVKAVASAQKPVTETQAATNTNEYQSLGMKAKELGMTPWLLRPTCDDFSMLADAGADAVPSMLGLVKRLTQQKMMQLVDKNAKAKKLTIAYGGALHNDLSPPEATAPYSFGPELARAVNGAYVELDLIVPEFVKKTPVWEKLPWFAAWDAEKDRAPKDRTTLYAIANGPSSPPSYVLVFPPSQ